jgi:hypothetical protein
LGLYARRCGVVKQSRYQLRIVCSRLRCGVSNRRLHNQGFTIEIFGAVMQAEQSRCQFRVVCSRMRCGDASRQGANLRLGARDCGMMVQAKQMPFQGFTLEIVVW